MRRFCPQDMRKADHQGSNLEKFLPVRQVIFESGISRRSYREEPTDNMEQWLKVDAKVA